MPRVAKISDPQRAAPDGSANAVGLQGGIGGIRQRLKLCYSEPAILNRQSFRGRVKMEPMIRGQRQRLAETTAQRFDACLLRRIVGLVSGVNRKMKLQVPINAAAARVVGQMLGQAEQFQFRHRRKKHLIARRQCELAQ